MNRPKLRSTGCAKGALQAGHTKPDEPPLTLTFATLSPSRPMLTAERTRLCSVSSKHHTQLLPGAAFAVRFL